MRKIRIINGAKNAKNEEIWHSSQNKQRGSFGSVLAEFEILFTQLKINIAGASSEEALMSARAKLAAISRDYTDSRPAVKGFAFGKVHYEAIHTLKKDESIVITRPDKGSGTVVMNREDYLGRMEVILQDESKFEQLGSVNTNDRTPQQERAFQAFLLRLKKATKITEDIYQRIRPVGSTRPRLYGLPKIHKPSPAPLWPILSMVGSAQHELAKWLTEVLQPVTLKYSTYVIKDSFTFAGALQQSRDRTGQDRT